MEIDKIISNKGAAAHIKIPYGNNTEGIIPKNIYNFPSFDERKLNNF